MNKINAVLEKISIQQKGHNEDKIYWLGEQLKDICKENESTAELVSTDLDNPDMSIVKLEKKIEEYACKHGGCTPPQAADKIIRDFYGLGAVVAEQKHNTMIDLSDYM